MMTDSYWGVLAGAAAVTYLIRVMPFILMGRLKIPRKVKRFLLLMPVAALGALIFPGAVTSLPEAPLAGLAGVAASVLAAWAAGGLIFPVFASVAVTWLWLTYL